MKEKIILRYNIQMENCNVCEAERVLNEIKQLANNLPATIDDVPEWERRLTSLNFKELLKANTEKHIELWNRNYELMKERDELQTTIRNLRYASNVAIESTEKFNKHIEEDIEKIKDEIRKFEF